MRLRHLAFTAPFLFLFACVAADSGSEVDGTSNAAGSSSGAAGTTSKAGSGQTAGTSAAGTSAAGTSAAGATGGGAKGGAAGKASGGAGGSTGGTDPFGGGGSSGDPFGGGGSSGMANDCTFDFDPCDDGNPCTEYDECYDGICEGYDLGCTPSGNDPCTEGVCNPATGACDPTPKLDGDYCSDPTDLCTSDKECQAGKCIGGVPKTCTTTSSCKTASCDPTVGCKTDPKADGAVCDDGNKCTFGDKCAAGVCSGVTAGATMLFGDAFSQDPTPWTVGPGWGVGVAVASKCDFSLADDPDTDHTDVTTDNRLAGTVLGGCVDANVITTPSYLESPVINASGGMATDPLFLTFWQKASFDGASAFSATVDVYDGTAWQQVWKSAGGSDLGWNMQTIDIAKHRNAAMKVRFGWAQLKKTGTPYAGWTIDDVQVGVPACM